MHESRKNICRPSSIDECHLHRYQQSSFSATNCPEKLWPGDSWPSNSFKFKYTTVFRRFLAHHTKIQNRNWLHYFHSEWKRNHFQPFEAMFTITWLYRIALGVRKPEICLLKTGHSPKIVLPYISMLYIQTLEHLLWNCIQGAEIQLRVDQKWEQ